MRMTRGREVDCAQLAAHQGSGAFSGTQIAADPGLALGFPERIARSADDFYAARGAVTKGICYRARYRAAKSLCKKGGKTLICSDFSAPRETRTPTQETLDKALNLARLPIPPQARAGCAV